MDAQTLFASLVRDELAPLIRAKGFKGSGSTFRRRSEDGAWVIVNFQRSRYSTREEVRFTVNLSATSELLRHLAYGWREGKPPTEAEGVVRQRLGFLLPDRPPADYWWLLDASTGVPQLARSLGTYLTDVGFPFLEQLTTNAGIRDHCLRLFADGHASGRELKALRDIAAAVGPASLVPEAEHALEELQSADVDMEPMLSAIANAGRGSGDDIDRVIRTRR